MTHQAVWASDDESLKSAYRAAAARFEDDFRRDMPYLWEQVGPWIYQGKPEGDITLGWTKPRGFPLLVLPRWYLASVRANGDSQFVADLDYSTVNGYYSVRLMDEVMDGELLFDPKIVVATTYLHSIFQGSFVRYFTHESGFWAQFHRHWNEHVDVTMRDAFLPEVGEAEFRTITGRKFAAAKIPLAAAAYWSDTADRLEPWLAIIAPLGRWQQMLNDLFDWHYDREHGTRTWLQTEATRQAAAGESPDAWFAREGFRWGRRMVDQLHDEVVAAAAGLGSAELDQYLARRKIEVDADLDEAAEGVEALGILASALG